MESPDRPRHATADASSPGSAIGRPLALAFVSGVVGGELFLALALARQGSDLLTTSPTSAFASWVVVRSIGLYGLLFGILGLLLGACVVALRPLVHVSSATVFAGISGVMVALSALAYLTVWWQIDVLEGLSLDDPVRRWGAARHVAASLVAGGLVFSGLRWQGRRLARRSSTTRLTRAVGAITLVLLLSIALAERALSPREPNRARRSRASRVVVVGLDGLTFRVLSPLVRGGRMPTFQRLMAEGAWGTLLTYGTASSPQIWTTLATGKRVRDHGIDDFVRPASDYRAVPLRSSDRKCLAIWNILSEAGLRVAIVNWMMTAPPEEVNGYVVSRLDFDEKNSTFPPWLRDEIEPLLIRAAPQAQPDEASLLEDVARSFAVARHLRGKEPVSLLALYTGAPDQAQHYFWRYYQPDAFDPRTWPTDVPLASPGASVITEVYERVEREMAELVGSLPEDTLLVVVSDHGQLAARHPRVGLRMDLLLQDLGYGVSTGRPSGGGIDHDRSRAYTLVETLWKPYLRVNLNVTGREPAGIVEPAEAPRLAEELARDLRGLRLDDGAHLFGRVSVASFGADHRRRGADADIRADLSWPARSVPPRQRTLRVGGQVYPLSRFLEVDHSISGNHDRQGVILLWGPAVRPGPIGQRVVSTPLQELLWNLTDKVGAVDSLLPPLRALGMIERVSTLDLTPTLLYALGLPVARDMAGRPRTDLFSGLGEPRWIDSYEGAPRRSPDAPPTSDEEMLERLRSLGYIR